MWGRKRDAGRSAWVWLAAVAGCSALVGLIPLAVHVITNPPAAAEATLRLGDRAVSWPYHSSIQRNSYAWINRPETLVALQEGSSSVQDLWAEEPDNNQFLVLGSEADSDADAVAALDEAIGRFVAYDLALQTDPVQAELDEILATTAQYEAQFLASDADLTDAEGDTEVIVARAELEGLGATLGGLRGREAEARSRLDAISDRYRVWSEPAPVPQLQHALDASIRLALAVFTGAVVLMVLFGRRSGRDVGDPAVQFASDVG